MKDGISIPITYHSDDIYPHIGVNGIGAQSVGSPSAIAAAETFSIKGVSLGGCTTVLSVIEVCYGIAGNTLTVPVKLKTPGGLFLFLQGHAKG